MKIPYPSDFPVRSFFFLCSVMSPRSLSLRFNAKCTLLISRVQFLCRAAPPEAMASGCAGSPAACPPPAGQLRNRPAFSIPAREGIYSLFAPRAARLRLCQALAAAGAWPSPPAFAQSEPKGSPCAAACRTRGGFPPPALRAMPADQLASLSGLPYPGRFSAPPLGASCFHERNKTSVILLRSPRIQKNRLERKQQNNGFVGVRRAAVGGASTLFSDPPAPYVSIISDNLRHVKRPGARPGV